MPYIGSFEKICSEKADFSREVRSIKRNTGKSDIRREASQGRPKGLQRKASTTQPTGLAGEVTSQRGGKDSRNNRKTAYENYKDQPGTSLTGTTDAGPNGLLKKTPDWRNRKRKQSGKEVTLWLAQQRPTVHDKGETR